MNYLIAFVLVISFFGLVWMIAAAVTGNFPGIIPLVIVIILATVAIGWGIEENAESKERLKSWAQCESI